MYHREYIQYGHLLHTFIELKMKYFEILKKHLTPSQNLKVVSDPEKIKKHNPAPPPIFMNNILVF